MKGGEKKERTPRMEDVCSPGRRKKGKKKKREKASGTTSRRAATSRSELAADGGKRLGPRRPPGTKWVAVDGLIAG